jgi:hypothetical protein
MSSGSNGGCVELFVPRLQMGHAGTLVRARSGSVHCQRDTISKDKALTSLPRRMCCCISRFEGSSLRTAWKSILQVNSRDTKHEY